ncbi:MAG: hypothetical protein EPO26_06115 [Chloroflexota bacterium]|nr:MAG: hypothetical protein EPO26_06115 [Chloroflexota bacterium]
MDRAGRIDGIAPTSEVTPPRTVRSPVGREQIDLFERMVEQGSHVAADPDADQELVTMLTQAEIEQIEERLPSESTVASILGRVLEYHPVTRRRPSRHLPSAAGHVDEDA